MTRFATGSAAALAVLAACASTIPKAELDRCALGVADGNEAFLVRQGAACTMVAQRLSADDKPRDAIGYARKACELEDARGCEQLLAIVRAQPSLGPDELLHARAAGEKACSGIVVGTDGTDARPAICAHTAELYEDVEPRSRSDAGRLFARACKLGDAKSCARAKALGVDPENHPVIVTAKPASSAQPPPPRPTAIPTLPPTPPPPPTTAGPTRPAATCHEMRHCVTLDVQQRNSSEVVGTLTNNCDGSVACSWCPARADQVDKSACHSTTLAPKESKAGRESGLWYDGYSGMAYDCADVSDDRGCLGI